ncbi:hypothetical protein CAP35_10465 [Chitinophagaceae bacterium IBVUCB1]|nr:hypothetical protein CAP35_10465 [Chitinophagaceae bacterium IBVUCB1]
MLEISLQGETIYLLPEKAIYWPAQNAIIVADMHWGKTGHFRKHGIAVPVNTQIHDEIRLAEIIRQYSASHLIVAGDLFHSVHNKEVESFGYWRGKHPDLAISLVVGNHDILDEKLYTDWGIALHTDILNIATFTISHDAVTNADGFVLHGHIHPAVKVAHNNNRMGLRLPAFCMDANRMVLPAFGDFTGSKLLEMNNFQHIYVVADTAVIQWK